MSFLYVLEGIRNPVLNVLMQAFTELGGELVFLVVAIIMLWCMDKKCGYYMLTVGFVGIICNQFLKLWFRIPRPWVKDPNFTIVESARAAATGYSFPSGHTQNAFTVMGAPARYYKNRTLRIVLSVLICLTAFSRMYLGVHTPYDVGVSFVLGLLLVFLLYPLFAKMEENPRRIYGLYAFCICISAAYLCFVYFYPFPADIDPANYAEGVKNGWMILFCSFGLLLVFYMDRNKLHWTTAAPLWAQVVKVAAGLIITLILKSGLKAPLNALFHGSPIAGGIRYGIVILFAGIVWPMTFRWFSQRKPLRSKED